MLVLTRKWDERIWLEVEGMEKPIEIVIVSVDRARIKIGFVADKSKVSIYRGEVYSEVLQERERKASTNGESQCPVLPTLPLQSVQSSNLA